MKANIPAPALVAMIFLASIAYAHAHHNSEAEYGSLSLPTLSQEGVIREINWANPHVSFEIELLDTEGAPSQLRELEAQSVEAMVGLGFSRSDFVVGDSIVAIGWASRRNANAILLRAIQVNNGPLRSTQRFRDMIDIAQGHFDQLGIVPARNLHGAPPERAGEDTVIRLSEMGLLDENGFFMWPRVNSQSKVP